MKTERMLSSDIETISTDFNYYNRYKRWKIDYGHYLMQRKNDVLVEIALPKDANIYVSEYKLYL